MAILYLYRAAFAALLCSQTLVNGFIHPAKTVRFQLPGLKYEFDSFQALKKTAVQVASTDSDLPPGFEIKETYEQGQVPLFAVVNATMRTSKLIYAFSSMKKDIRENPDAWLDGEDMLKEGTLMEEDIGDFCMKNSEKVESDYPDMMDYQLGIKGDNRLRCLDSRFQNEELVYGINVNRSRKQVTVAFRGTNTPTDLLVDLDFRRFTVKDGDALYGVHNGFRKYLNAETAEEGDGDTTKLEEITQELEAIMESDCEGFDVFVTGHSLGGALATLYGLRLAQSEKFPVVNIVSYASPYVGTEGFRKVFRQAELDGLVRHIRVSNSNDCIPVNPCIGGFEHVGVNLELRSTGPVMIYEGVENPSIPAAFFTFCLGAGPILLKFLVTLIGFSSLVPTILLLPSALLAYVSTNILLENHWFDKHRERFNTGLESAGFLALTIEEAYEKRLKKIAETGA